MRFLVTGGYGFIGSAVLRALAGAGHKVWVLDKMTYAANPDAAEGAAHTHVEACLTDRATVDQLLAEAEPDAIIHLAAETHVDRSIDRPGAFMVSNVEGTYTLLEAALAWWSGAGAPEAFRLVHVSTDEVFGDLGPGDAPFEAATPYCPSSPYAASKAASDHLVRAWHRTYGLPGLVTNCSNNYGPWQNREKLIPTVIRKAVTGQPIPVYGRGENIRDWLHVEDHARGLIAAASTGAPGATYLFGARAERRNLDLVNAICSYLDRAAPAAAPHRDQIEFVADRPGHDRRYAIDPASAESGLGWRAETAFEAGLARTIDWYLGAGVSADRAGDDRLGLLKTGDER